MHRYYVQKARFGAKFNHQVTAFIPFSSNAKALMLMRGKAISAWKAVRRVLPADLKTSLERRFFAL
jgi:hypothetical protein